MFKKIFFFLFLFLELSCLAQEIDSDFRKKFLIVKQDTIQLDSVSLNSQRFKLLNADKNVIPKAEYSIDFLKAILVIDRKKYKNIYVEYFRLPKFVRKVYTPFDDQLIIKKKTNQGKLYSLTTNKKNADIDLFEGLETKGFIVRGLTSGNNQNSVTNAALDLEISGKLSKNVTLRANIFDMNIPIQQNGYSQNLTDFDRVFIEMFTKDWRVKAGDLSLENTETFFSPFVKQVAGLKVEAQVSENLNLLASGAVVRGKFNTFKFTGLEGNQGPYKILGANNEAAILIIEDSERVYVNGALLKRGETEQYIINYNLGEITFNTTFPITNDMRIWIDFQYAERNYTRFVTYEKAEYKGDKFSLSGYFYSENDAKNQPLQQSLTNSQKEVLANAGNDSNAMFAESAFIDTFDENKILYRKIDRNNEHYFEYASNEDDELYSVTFTNVGANNGNYKLQKSIAIGNIFEFVGQNEGDYNPVVRLVAPTKSQIFVVKSALNPTKKTKLNAEVAISNNDENLFSTLGDDQNIGVAAKINWEQLLIDKDWKLKSTISHEYAQQQFNTLQRYEPVEFNRDWNIITNNATKNYLQSSINFQKSKHNFISYRFNHLSYDNSFKGFKHRLLSKIKHNKTTFLTDASYTSNSSNLENNYFLRARAKAEYHLKKTWYGALVHLETNSRKNTATNQFITASHRFKEYETYFGLGDSTKIFAKIGVNYRNNDSIKTNNFTRINTRKTIYIKSKLIQNKTTNLSIYANYRATENAFFTNEKTLNSKLLFTQKLFKNFINVQTIYETSSGNVARQDYVYIQTEPGLGYYTWRDYNNDGIKDFNEFEIAQFQDQANFLRLPKPNFRFTATQRAKWKQNITVNPKSWRTKSGFKKVISKFYNQSYLIVENEQERVGNTFQLNPFDFEENNLIGLNLNFRNSLFFNKDLQNNSFTYTYGNSKLKQQYFIGNLQNTIKINQLDYAHKFADFWLIELLNKYAKNSLATENFTDRNYRIHTYEIHPKLSFLYTNTHRFSAFYHFKNKKNKIQDLESLAQQKFGIEYFYMDKQQNQISANLNVFLNDFAGNTNSPVAYQMLEGLQAGKNYTWNLLFNKKLNSFLNLNLNYFGRKSENAKTIHTGSVQLRAVF